MADLERHTMASTIVVNDRMQQGYRYVLSEPAGRNFDAIFEPDLTPAQCWNSASSAAST
jgi:hypothetical protein